MQLAEQLAVADMISLEYLSPNFPERGKERISIDELTSRELDALPFGAIQLTRAGMILKYNQYESTLSHIQKQAVIGRNFFTDIAPCTRVREFYGAFKEGVAKKHLFQKFRFRFAFKTAPVDVNVTLFYSDVTDSIWVLIQPI